MAVSWKILIACVIAHGILGNCVDIALILRSLMELHEILQVLHRYRKLQVPWSVSQSRSQYPAVTCTEGKKWNRYHHMIGHHDKEIESSNNTLSN
jgi:hypothetical protein